MSKKLPETSDPLMRETRSPSRTGNCHAPSYVVNAAGASVRLCRANARAFATDNGKRVGSPRLSPQRRTMRSSSRTGSRRSSKAFAIVETAVERPMPSASVATAAMANPGERAIVRVATRMCCTADVFMERSCRPNRSYASSTNRCDHAPNLVRQRGRVIRGQPTRPLHRVHFVQERIQHIFRGRRVSGLELLRYRIELGIQRVSVCLRDRSVLHEL